MTMHRVECKLVLFTNRKSYVGFLLVPKSVTLNALNGIMAVICIVTLKVLDFKANSIKHQPATKNVVQRI